MTDEERKRIARVASEAAKLRKDYPHLSIEEAVAKAKEVIK